MDDSDADRPEEAGDPSDESADGGEGGSPSDGEDRPPERPSGDGGDGVDGSEDEEPERPVHEGGFEFPAAGDGSDGSDGSDDADAGAGPDEDSGGNPNTGSGDGPAEAPDATDDSDGDEHANDHDEGANADDENADADEGDDGDGDTDEGDDGATDADEGDDESASQTGGVAPSGLTEAYDRAYGDRPDTDDDTPETADDDADADDDGTDVTEVGAETAAGGPGSDRDAEDGDDTDAADDAVDDGTEGDREPGDDPPDSDPDDLWEQPTTDNTFGDEETDDEFVPEDVTTGGGSTGAPTAGAAAAGAGAGAGAGAAGGHASGYDYDPDDPMAGAPDDQEMPLTEHVREMTYRLLVVLLVVLGVGAVATWYADDLINFLWYSFLGPGRPVCPGPGCPEIYRPRVYQPLALVLARLKAGALIGFVAALPVAVYQTYRFMRPGLYPRERRYYLAAVPTSLVLAVVGVTFAYFLVLPLLFSYFAGYSQQAADLAFGLTDTFNLIVTMMGFFAIVFQIPLLVMLAVLMGVTSREWLEQRRLYFWAGFAGIAFLFSPDPTGMAPLLVAATMIALFDGTLTLLRWATEGTPVPGPEGLAAYRPVAWLLFALAGYLVSAAPVPGSYYDAIPTVVTDALVSAELVGATPLLVGGGLVAVFEGTAYLNRRAGYSEPLYDALRRLRLIVWPGAAVVGYLASPSPDLVVLLRDVALSPTVAGGIVVGLAVAYEATIVGLRLRNRTEA